MDIKYVISADTDMDTESKLGFLFYKYGYRFEGKILISFWISSLMQHIGKFLTYIFIYMHYPIIPSKYNFRL